VFKKIGLPVKLYTTFHGYDIRQGFEKENVYVDLFNNADGIFSISEFNTRSLLKLGAPEHLILPLFNGIDIDFYKCEARVSPSKVIRLMTVARLVKEKALHIAIQAVGELHKENPQLDFEYTIVGDGEERHNLENLVQNLDLANKITFVGVKNSREVRDIMVNSDLFLLSSESEALPTVLLEAQACGLVVLATNVGSVKDVVKGGLVVTALDINAFKNGLLQLIDNQKDWSKLSKVGRDYICRNHAIDIQTNMLLFFYKA
jgi:colanic acid/amylovoran biosynthesis glycosyltransferase